MTAGTTGAGTGPAASTDPQPEPDLIVTKGHPSTAQLAALIAVLARRAGSAAADPVDQRAGWGAYWRRIQSSPPPGPDGWRASARPR